MVFRELRATVVVMPGIDIVDTFQLGLLAQFLSQFLSNAVDTAYRGNNPYLITHTHITILTLIALEGAVLFLDGQFFANGVVGIFERTGKIGLQIILVDPVTGFQILTCMTDGIAVFDDVFSLFDIFDKNLVTGWCVLINNNLLAVCFDDFSFFLWLQADYHTVCRINF